MAVVPKIYTMAISQPARALSWACAYEGTKVEEVIVQPGKDTRTKEYLAKHPLGTVPRLEEGDFVLSESHAIMSYLGDKYNWKLYPKDPHVRARIHQYMNWHHNGIRKVTTSLFGPIMRPDIPVSKEYVELVKADIPNYLAIVERWLSESAWLCGDMPTVADLACYCEIGQALDKYIGLFALNGIDLAPFPRIAAWAEACEKLDGYEQSHALLKKLSPGMSKKAAKSKL